MLNFAEVSSWESSLLTSVVTLIVGLLAFAVYRKQQIDRKKDAANIIFLEIKNAEKNLTQAKDIIVRDKVLPESIFAMKTPSWGKYNYLFVRDFDDKDWNIINTFYEKCRLYDEAVEYSNTFFKKNEEQIRVNLHQALAEYTKALLKTLGENSSIEDEEERVSKDKADLEEYQNVLKGFHNTFMTEQTEGVKGYFYRPNKAFSDGEAIISTIRLDLSTSTLGTTFKDIVNQNFRSRLVKKVLSK